ncbi:MAG: hypothetical protein IPP48_14365 [Chitinophagaceae bacterium]|nr:hypothetical protein [Chitinophagaceae bacterium]
MKNFTSLALLCAVVCTSTLLISCDKADPTTRPKEQLIVGNWEIGRIQLKVFYGGVFVKDTILKQAPRPKNYANFDANGGFAYKWNLNAADIGTYQFKGTDSVITNAIPNAYRWKMLTLTEDIFTVMNTTTNEPLYPGATVERYHTFIR